MAALVVDASVALAWALPDEISDYADAVLAAVETEGLRVPGLWQYEMDALSRLTISVDQAVDTLFAISNGAAWARRYSLTAYDAAYVELAAREGLLLATLDQRMREAALDAGVTLFELPTGQQQ